MSLKFRKKNGTRYTNPFKENARIIEIQYGEETSEDDIERHGIL
jgi:hypothetical protein